MDKSSFSEIILTLEKYNSEIDSESNGVVLSNLFLTCQRLRDLIEESSLPSNDKDYQEGVSVCIKALENCTSMVNDLELFSSNESEEDLQTSSIRYLLLPAMLGYLNLTLQTSNFSERAKYIERSEIYFKDFLLRCTNYDLCKDSLRFFKESLKKECNNKSESALDVSSLRERKIEIFKRKKELESREKLLQLALERPDLEDSIREYYLVLVEKWILIATEELENLKREADILKSMPTSGKQNNTLQQKKNVKPLKPFILTKTSLQKEVFGLGYPSIPVLTIDDFYRQRFEKAINEQKEQNAGKSLQDSALKGEGLKAESEEIEKEELLEKDDPAAILKARQWDDWKDENPRGSGNRYNKG